MQLELQGQDDAHALHSTNRHFRSLTSAFITRMVLGLLADRSEDSFKSWPRLAKLRVLDIQYKHLNMCMIADQPGAMQILANVTELRVGELMSHTRINSDDMAAIARACPSLECLHLGIEDEFYSEDGYITAEDGDILRHLHDLPMLRTLFVDLPHEVETTIWNNLIASLPSLPVRLSKVDLCFGDGAHGMTLRQCIAAVSTVPGFHGLSTTAIPDTSTADWFSGLEEIGTLRKLIWWNHEVPQLVGMLNLASLLNCGQLTDLEIFEGGVSGDAIVALLEMPSLRILLLPSLDNVLPRIAVRAAPLEELHFAFQGDDWTPLLSCIVGLTQCLSVSPESHPCTGTMHITSDEDASRVPGLMALMPITPGSGVDGVSMQVHVAKGVNFIPCIEPIRQAFGTFTLHQTF